MLGFFSALTVKRCHHVGLKHHWQIASRVAVQP